MSLSASALRLRRPARRGTERWTLPQPVRCGSHKRQSAQPGGIGADLSTPGLPLIGEKESGDTVRSNPHQIAGRRVCFTFWGTGIGAVVAWPLVGVLARVRRAQGARLHARPKTETHPVGPAGLRGRLDYVTIRAGSSPPNGPVAQRQSGRLITGWSLVRIRLGPPPGSTADPHAPPAC